MSVESERGAWLSHPVLGTGFRPFFLLGGLVAFLWMGLWVGSLQGWWQVGGGLGAVSWHSHEMLFGFTSAIIAGFLLTAVANWTGSPTAGPVGLLGLVGLWCVGRVAVLLSGSLPLVVVGVVDVLFLPSLALVLARPLWKARSWRNIGFVGILLLMATANAFFYLGVAGVVGLWAGRVTMLMFHLILLLVSIIGGRVIPLFTQNRLRALGQELTIYKMVWLGWGAAACLLVVALGHFLDAPRPIWSIAMLVGGVLLLVRMLGWKGHRTWNVPMLWVLHIGYGCLASGLIWKGAQDFRAVASSTAALHLLGVGCIGVMCLGMMSRVSLGHTGRPIEAHPITTVAFLLLLGAAVVRVVPAVWFPLWYAKGLLAAGLLWCSAFGLFLLVYGPVLLRPRADGRPG